MNNATSFPLFMLHCCTFHIYVTCFSLFNYQWASSFSSKIWETYIHNFSALIHGALPQALNMADRMVLLGSIISFPCITMVATQSAMNGVCVFPHTGAVQPHAGISSLSVIRIFKLFKPELHLCFPNIRQKLICLLSFTCLPKNQNMDICN